MTDTVSVTVPSSRRWQWWRDLVILVLAVTVGALVYLVVDGQREMRDFRSAVAGDARTAAAQRDRLQTRLIELTTEIRDASVREARKDAEIKRLTDIIIGANLDPGVSLVDGNADGDLDLDLGQPGTAASPTPAPSATPSRSPAPSPRPTPRPSPSPSLSPSPTPTPTPPPPVPLACQLLPILPGCP